MFQHRVPISGKPTESWRFRCVSMTPGFYGESMDVFHMQASETTTLSPKNDPLILLPLILGYRCDFVMVYSRYCQSWFMKSYECLWWLANFTDGSDGQGPLRIGIDNQQPTNMNRYWSIIDLTELGYPTIPTSCLRYYQQSVKVIWDVPWYWYTVSLQPEKNKNIEHASSLSIIGITTFVQGWLFCPTNLNV